jgi:ABC-type multidrug transport system ATPase subunit
MTTKTLSLEVKKLFVRKGGRFLVEDASLTVRPGEFVIILGPNGAGKTTLLRAIRGERPYSGEIRVNGQDLYAAPERWLRHIGQVPSHNVLHENLTLRQALRYKAQLHHPELSLSESEGRIESLLREFELSEGLWDSLVGRLSDGERKLANICAELLGEPPLLILDEPTSGLDRDRVRLVMERLKYRAEQHRRAVLITSHTTEDLEFGDRVVFMGNGRIICQGPPGAILEAMKAPDWPSAYRIHRTNPQLRGGSASLPCKELDLPQEPDLSWPRGQNEETVLEAGVSKDDSIATHVGDFERSVRAISTDPRGDVLRQARVLVHRNWRIFFNEPWWKQAITMLFGPFASLLFALVLEQESFIESLYLYGHRYPRVLDIANLRNAVYLLALVITMLGLTGSFREIANEFHIYRHERLKGLSPGAYLAAKMSWLIPIFGLAMPLLLFWTLLWSQVLPPEGVFLAPAGEAMITLILASMAAVVLGLAISAIGSTRENATVGLAIAIVCNALLAGLEKNQQFKELTDRLSVVTSSRWAMEGVATSLKIYCWSNPLFKDYPSIGHLVSVWVFLLAYILAAAVITYSALRLKDSWARHWLHNLRVRSLVPILVLILILILSGQGLRNWSAEAYDLRADVDATVTEIVAKTGQSPGAARLSVAYCPQEEIVPEDQEETGTFTLPTPVPGIEIRPKNR